MLQVDTKIATKCIANRIKKVLPSIIHLNQTGFINNRYIGENIRRIIALIYYCEEIDYPALILIIDYEKAFDKLSHNCILKTLSFFNFGPVFISWIKTFYGKISSTIDGSTFLILLAIHFVAIFVVYL